MYAYYVNEVGTINGRKLLQLGAGRNWETFEPGTAPIYVSPFVDYHAVNGTLFLNNKEATLIECKEEGVINTGDVFILAHCFPDAKKMLKHG